MEQVAEGGDGVNFSSSEFTNEGLCLWGEPFSRECECTQAAGTLHQGREELVFSPCHSEHQPWLGNLSAHEAVPTASAVLLVM